uniref:Uncharacterized protein n=1 Tax=Anguilla anguilla TaxID=7936 RepID=A0A0E9Q6D0_ANGAN
MLVNHLTVTFLIIVFLCFVMNNSLLQRLKDSFALHLNMFCIAHYDRC